jgi:hypothetical protein
LAVIVITKPILASVASHPSFAKQNCKILLYFLPIIAGRPDFALDSPV